MSDTVTDGVVDKDIDTVADRGADTMTDKYADTVADRYIPSDKSIGSSKSVNTISSAYRKKLSQHLRKFTCKQCDQKYQKFDTRLHLQEHQIKSHGLIFPKFPVFPKSSETQNNPSAYSSAKGGTINNPSKRDEKSVNTLSRPRMKFTCKQCDQKYQKFDTRLHLQEHVPMA